ncbi:MAG: hypothetical protein M0009_08335 [Deltaproteobacteria bacterium]|nr:hypothetical protein [Deltaproteobacteria bacterium]
MSKTVLSRKGYILISLAALFVFTAANAFAYDWIIHFPDNLSGDKCHVTANAKGGKNASKVMTTGMHWTWRSGTEPLTTITGWCENYPGGMTSSDHLVSRTCEGADYSTVVSGNISCSSNVRLRICMKDNGKAGFCPE